MNKKITKSNDSIVILSFFAILLFVYIILFEFILPANQIIPKPTILLETIPVLFEEYNFITNLLFTFSVIYSVMIITHFIFKIGYKALFYIIDLFPGIHSLFLIGKYLLPIFMIFLFNIWFGNSVYGEYLFSLILIMGSLKTEASNQFNNPKKEYIDSARSLGLTDNKLLGSIILKSIQPDLFAVYIKQHFLIWTFIIIYEYISMSDGIGSIYRKALEYNDLSLIIVITVSLILLFLIMESILNQIKKKFFFWN